jgi:hypothetical protein
MRHISNSVDPGMLVSKVPLNNSTVCEMYE